MESLLCTWDPATVASITRLQEMEYKYTVWVTRFVIIRLVNHLGYDLVSYDSDAIVLKNTQTLFDQHPNSDVIGSAGRYPFELGKKWGFTVCLGVILFRSNPRTGERGVWYVSNTACHVLFFKSYYGIQLAI